MTDYLMLLTAVLLLADDFAINKLYQKKVGADARAVLLFNCINGLLTAGIFFVINGILNGFSFEFHWYSFLMAASMALFGLSYNFIGFRMLRDGNMASYTLFLMTGGMVLPYVVGLIGLNEPFSVLRTLGLGVIFAGVFSANAPKTRPSSKYMLMGGAVFVLNGLVSTVSKLHQIENTIPTVSSASFVMLSGLARSICCALALAFMKKGSETGIPKRNMLIYLIAVSALFGGVSYLLQLVGAKSLPATVLYPIITGGSIIFSALAGRVFFKERIGKQTLVGIALCFLGTCMFL